MIAYKQLSTIYHDIKQRDSYQEIYERRFWGDGTFRLPLMKKDHNGQDIPLFVVITTDAYSIIQDIYKALQRLERLIVALPPAAIQGHINYLLIDEMIKTNAMEGIHSSRKDIENAIKANKDRDNRKSDRKLRFQNQVAQYQKMLQGEELHLDSVEAVRKLYDAFVYDEVKLENEQELPDGRIFRKGAVDVVSETGRVLHQGVMPEEEVIRLMEKWLLFLNDDSYPALLRAAVTHYYFGYIHPFYNGNGRLSRLITSYLLAEETNVLVALRLSVTLHDNRKKYYKAFEAVNDVLNKGDATPFYHFFLEQVDEILNELVEELESKNQILRFTREKVDEITSLTDDEKATLYVMKQADLFSGKNLTIKVLKENLEVGQAKMKRILDGLEQKGYISVNKTGRSYRYELCKGVLE